MPDGSLSSDPQVTIADDLFGTHTFVAWVIGRVIAYITTAEHSRDVGRAGVVASSRLL
jgi:hypothetical protein